MALTNNDIFKKLRVAHKLRDDDIVKICELVDFKVSKSELGAIFRKEDHPKYMECGDQFLRNFLNGLVIHLRGPMPPPNATQLSKNFTALVSSFDAMSVITDPTMGIRALLEGQNSNQTPIVVISLEEKRILSVRLVINKPAIEWLIQNVPEDKEYG